MEECNDYDISKSTNDHDTFNLQNGEHPSVAGIETQWP